MLEVVQTEIDGYEFTYQPLMATPARALFDKLVQRFGPAVAGAVRGLKDADLSDDMEMAEALGSVTESVGSLISGLASGLDPKFHAQLVDDLFKQVQFKNEHGNFAPLDKGTREIMFGTKLLLEMKLVSFCLKAQFSDFLAPLQSLTSSALALRAQALSRSASRPASTGSPPASPQASATPTA
jgi:hypothetical protein